jgi:hypothetical protein
VKTWRFVLDFSKHYDTLYPIMDILVGYFIFLKVVLWVYPILSGWYVYLMAPSSIAIYTHWEVLRGFLAFVGVVVGLFFGVLLVHSIQFDTWNENFSKQGLKRHIIELIDYTLLFLMLGTIAAIVKSIHFPSDKK